MLKYSADEHKDKSSMSCNKSAIVNISSLKGSITHNDKSNLPLRSDTKDCKIGNFGGGRYQYRTSKVNI